MSGIERESLPTVDEGREIAQQRAEADTASSDNGSASAQRDRESEQVRARIESVFLTEPQAAMNADIEELLQS